MAETKTFLSLTGLQHYDEKIKALIKSQGKDVTDKLIALIGAAEKGADTKTILDRVAELEKAVGNVQNLPGEVKELVAAILGEATRAQAAEGTLGNRLNAIEGEGEGSIKKALADAKAYADGKDAAIAAAQKAGDDAQKNVDALEAKVGTVAEGKTVVQMIGEANTNITNLTTRIGTAEGEIDTLQTDMDAVEAKAAANETAIGVLNGEGAGSVKKKIDDAFNDFASKISDDGTVNTYKELIDYCATHSSEAAEMAGNIAANATAISELNTKVGAIPEGANAATVIDYVDKKVEAEKSRSDNAIKTAVEALDANLSQEAGADGLALHITEVDGKITAISGSIKAETYDAHGAAKAVQGETTKTVKELEDDLAAIGAISDAEIDALFTTVNA